MERLGPEHEAKLKSFAHRLVDQSRARVVVAPTRQEAGFWFGGGNLVEDRSGHLYLVGRYRNQGDSRAGLAEGERGCELAIFTSPDRGRRFRKIVSLNKTDLSLPERAVLSIEGSALRVRDASVELFFSTEKQGIGYPHPYEDFLKPGCGVWTVDRLTAPSIEELPQGRVETVFASTDPEHLHLKDPHVYAGADGSLVVMFCSHPFSWSSSNTVFARRAVGASDFDACRFGLFPRGTTWDVAIARGSCLLDVPAVGDFRDRRVTLLFYDGGESLRNLEEHARGVRRPRGYSCEELGGLAYFLDGDWTQIHRLSTTLPEFISPHGTGCSRYVDVLSTRDGFFTTWQQSQPDLSQPLVMHFVPRADAESLLGG